MPWKVDAVPKLAELSPLTRQVAMLASDNAY